MDIELLNFRFLCYIRFIIKGFILDGKWGEKYNVRVLKFKRFLF